MDVEKLNENIFCILSPVFSFYVVKAEKIALFELGISQVVPEVIYHLRQDLQIEKVNYLIAQHCHFDHIGGFVRFKEFFPEAILISHPNTKKVFKETETISLYQRTMEKLNSNPLFKMVFPKSDEIVQFERPEVEISAEENFLLNLGEGITLKVVHTPGHTPCTFSLWEEKSKTIFVSDAIGAPLPSGRIWPTAFNSFLEYKNSMEKIKSLQPKNIGLGHIGFLKGENVENFFQKTKEETEKYIALLKDLAKNKTEEEIHKFLFSEYQNDLISYIQPNIFKFGNREMLKQILLPFSNH